MSIAICVVTKIKLLVLLCLSPGERGWGIFVAFGTERIGMLDFMMMLLWAYFLLVWTPVNWVLVELTEVSKMRRALFRIVVLRTIQFRITYCRQYYAVEAKAMWFTPYRRVVLSGSRRYGMFLSHAEAEHAVDCVKADIRVWLRGRNG